MFTILHVEHNRFYHEIVKNMLIDEGLNYVSVKSPREAYRVLEDNKVNLIITGLVFMDESGEEFVKELQRGRYKNLPIVIMTSNDDEEMKGIISELGHIDYIHKNASMDKFKGLIKKYISRDSTYEKLRRMKIAVLSDNELELGMIRKMFASNNIVKADYYSDPELFLKSDESYNLHIIDYMLHKITGEKVISYIRDKNRQGLIFATAGAGNEDMISDIINSGANDYIVKPFNEDMLLARLRVNLMTILPK